MVKIKDNTNIDSAKAGETPQQKAAKTRKANAKKVNAEVKPEVKAEEVKPEVKAKEVEVEEVKPEVKAKEVEVEEVKPEVKAEEVKPEVKAKEVEVEEVKPEEAINITVTPPVQPPADADLNETKEETPIFPEDGNGRTHQALKLHSDTEEVYINKAGSLFEVSTYSEKFFGKAVKYKNPHFKK